MFKKLSQSVRLERSNEKLPLNTESPSLMSANYAKALELSAQRIIEKTRELWRIEWTTTATPKNPN